ncbi:hypothetical protein [Streptomyces sp. NPDC051364]|uniref:hypothetical protein n=1 Tax=Streptomyces sp. NPDC051364 TaxID=3155799 RepID=UPI003447D92A
MTTDLADAGERLEWWPDVSGVEGIVGKGMNPCRRYQEWGIHPVSAILFPSCASCE